jgi:hypothetical protein
MQPSQYESFRTCNTAIASKFCYQLGSVELDFEKVRFHVLTQLFFTITYLLVGLDRRQCDRASKMDSRGERTPLWAEQFSNICSDDN